jgi:hypothetical protein
VTQQRGVSMVCVPRCYNHDKHWVPKFHVALHASHAALPMVTPKISPYCTPPDVELKFFGWNQINAEWTRHQDILIDWPSVETWLKHMKINIWRILHNRRWPCKPKHVAKDNENQHTIKLHADGNITCNTHWTWLWLLILTLTSLWTGPSYSRRLYIQGPVPPGVGRVRIPPP